MLKNKLTTVYCNGTIDCNMDCEDTTKDCISQKCFSKILKRLHNYECTGLTPAQVLKLAKNHQELVFWVNELRKDN